MEVVAVLALLVDRPSAMELGRGGAHDSVAALDAAGGGRLRSVVAIFPLDVRSFGLERSVFSIPPFFSGLGVLVRGSPLLGGARFGDVDDCKLFVRGSSSSPELRMLA